MAAAAPVALAVMAATTAYSGYEAHKQAADARAAADEQSRKVQGQVNAQNTADQTMQKNQSQTAAAAAALARARMAGVGTAGGTILTGGLGAPPAPVASKTLLGG